MNLHTHDKVEIDKPSKVLILGSGALKIGEAGEFDYSGSQAIKQFLSAYMYSRRPMRSMRSQRFARNSYKFKANFQRD